MTLSNLLHKRYGKLGESNDLATGAALTQWLLDDGYAESLTKQEDLCKRSRHFCDRYDSLEDIEVSIHFVERAVNLANEDQVELSRNFYEILGQRIRDQGHLCDAAFALHEAVQACRRKKPRDPLSWVPLVYLET